MALTLNRKLALIAILCCLAWMSFLAGCRGLAPAAEGESWQPGKLHVIATTSIIGDILQNVGGDLIDVKVLVPPGVDEHSFQYSAADIARVAGADVLFMNGAGLETYMEPLLESAGSDIRRVDLSNGLQLLDVPVGGEVVTHGQDEHGKNQGDPHLWTDPQNVKTWVDKIAGVLIEMDGENQVIYQANAEKYQQSLIELEEWIAEQIAQIPEAKRQLVTDHVVFTYFAVRYGFKQVGAVIPGYSTVAEPSARELAQLEDAIRALGVKVVFVGKTANQALVERLAADTGTRLVSIYTGSLTGPDGPASTYLDYMRYNVSAIVEALR